MKTGDKYLLTFTHWFIGPDGKYYNAAWGGVTILPDSVLGVKTNRNSTNWYCKIGSEKNHVIVAGCQVNYAVRCEEKPTLDKVNVSNLHEGKYVFSERETSIYIAE